MIPGVTTIYGEPGTCKTSLALTWPKPIAFYDLENGGRRAWGIDKLIADNVVQKRTITIPLKSLTKRYDKLDGYKAAWDSFTSQVSHDLDSKVFSTIVWDTGTLIWSLVRDAFLEERQIERPNKKTLDTIEYAEPNRRMTTLYQLIKAYEVHLVVTHHSKDEYVPELAANKPIKDDQGNVKMIQSGNKLPDGFKETLALSDLVLYTRLENNNIPHVLVTKSLYGLDLRGQDIEWPEYKKLDSRIDFFRGGAYYETQK